MSRSMVEEILARYGETVTVESNNGNAAEALAFLQPVTKQNETVPEHMTGIGWSDGRLWLYLGDMAVDTGDSVIWKEQRFRVRSGRPWYLGHELNHWWALLEQAKEAAE